MRFHAPLLLALCAICCSFLGCSSEPASDANAPPAEATSSSTKQGKPHVPRHTWDDDEIQRIDFPEATVRAPDGAQPGAPAPAKRTDPVRPNVKLALTVYEVISWDDVKIRGGLRGSSVKGVVSLTGWLAKAKSASRTEVKVAAGREAALDVEEPLRALVGQTATFRVAVLDSTEKGELELAVTAALALEDQQVAPATRVKLGAGEALVVGGHRSEEGDSPKVDRLVLIEASTTR